MYLPYEHYFLRPEDLSRLHHQQIYPALGLHNLL